MLVTFYSITIGYISYPLFLSQEDIEPYYQAYYCLAKMLEDSKLKVRCSLGEL